MLMLVTFKSYIDNLDSMAKEVKKRVEETIPRVIGNVGLILLAVYGIVVSTLGYMTFHDFKYILVDILCIGGLVRVGYDMAKDIEEVYKPIARSFEGIVSNIVMKGVLLAIGIMLLMNILSGWKIPYPNNWGLLAVVSIITTCIIYDMVKDFSEYHTWIIYRRKVEHGGKGHGHVEEVGTVIKRRYRYWNVTERE